MHTVNLSFLGEKIIFSETNKDGSLFMITIVNLMKVEHKTFLT